MANEKQQDATVEATTAEETKVTTQTAVGRTSATERDPSTSDKFNFWLSPDVIVNPFDIVEVEQVAPENKASKTYGLLPSSSIGLMHLTTSPILFLAISAISLRNQIPPDKVQPWLK